jgi:hypothetical protein
MMVQAAFAFTSSDHSRIRQHARRCLHNLRKPESVQLHVASFFGTGLPACLFRPASSSFFLSSALASGLLV